jgi:hypothetical protein
MQHGPLPATKQPSRSSSSSSSTHHTQQQDQQQQQQDQQLVGQLLPLLLAVTDDPSPSVQRYGQAGLGWLGFTGLTSSSSSSSSSSGPDSLAASKAAANLAVTMHPMSQTGKVQHSLTSQGQLAGAQHISLSEAKLTMSAGLPRVRAASLVWHRVLLLDVARRLVVGCEEGSWATAMPAATSLVMVRDLAAGLLLCFWYYSKILLSASGGRSLQCCQAQRWVCLASNAVRPGPGCTECTGCGAAAGGGLRGGQLGHCDACSNQPGHGERHGCRLLL